MLYNFDIDTWIVTTVSGVSDTLTRRATLRLQLVNIIKLEDDIKQFTLFLDIKLFDSRNQYKSQYYTFFNSVRLIWYTIKSIEIAVLLLKPFNYPKKTVFVNNPLMPNIRFS